MRPPSRQNPPQTTRKVAPRTSRYKPAGGGSNGVVKWISGFVIFLVIGFGIRLCNKSIDDKEVLAEMHKVIVKAPNYSKYSDYYDALIDKFHSTAFEKAYRIGGRHRANTLNEKAYIQEMASLMLNQAKEDNRKEVVEVLEIVNENAKTVK